MLETVKGDALEIDELCVRKSPSLWLWIVRSRKTGQVVASLLGPRSVASLAVLWNRVPAAYRRKLVYTISRKRERTGGKFTRRSSLGGSISVALA